jgi:energy-coupling factor transporter ATP-binding protein EcfA2
VASETYDVFVSYSRADWQHAAEIDSVLRAKGLRSFFDRRNLAPGLPWVRALEQAIGAAKAVIVLIGPRGLGNTQQYERELALVRQSRNPAFPVVPVILPKTTTDRPFDFLNVLTWVDFSQVASVSDAPDELARLLTAVHGAPSPGDMVREAICPYRGLDAFREEDSAFFFGRGSASEPESTIGQLMRKVGEHSFVMVVGRSGSGKSSLVYAGLLPALRHERDRFWNVLSLRPGPAPLRALAAAFNPRADDEGAAEYATKITNEAAKLRTGDPELLSHMIREELDRAEGKPDRLLLYIDQWEELYAQAPSSSDRERVAQHATDVNRFIDLLLTAERTAPVAVVATVRADFYDPLIAHQEIRLLLPTRQVLLGAMPRSELERTIVEPARKVGLAFDPPGLVQRILDEAGEDEGMLPLLEYALKETWGLRKGDTMTADSYARSGGVREAIRITAERAFGALSSEDQQAARQLFLRLVTPGEGKEDTRARAVMPLEPAQRKIVEQFAGPRMRLLVTGSDRAARPTVEVAHEALIRTWPRLRGWIDANREKLRARAAVLQAKADWEQNGKRSDMLLPAGLQLERARTLLADPDITTDDIKGFIDESERRTRRFAPLTLPLVAVVLFGLVFVVYSASGGQDPNFPLYIEGPKFPIYVGAFSITNAITYGFGYWRYAGITFRRAILYGVVSSVVGFASQYELMTTLARNGFYFPFALYWWLIICGVRELVISAIFVPLMRRIAVWLPLLILATIPYGTLLWLHYSSPMPMARETVEPWIDLYVIFWLGALGFQLWRRAR